MKRAIRHGLLAGAVALTLGVAATSSADIESVQPQPTVYMNMSFGGSGDEPVQNTLGFRVDYDLSQISRRLNNQISLPSMLKAEYGADGKVYLFSNGVPLNNHDYRLNADGAGSFGALDFVALLGALGAGYFIYEEIEKDDEPSNNNGGGTPPGGGGGGGGTGLPTGSPCSSLAAQACASGVCVETAPPLPAGQCQ